MYIRIRRFLIVMLFILTIFSKFNVIWFCDTSIIVVSFLNSKWLLILSGWAWHHSRLRNTYSLWNIHTSCGIYTQQSVSHRSSHESSRATERLSIDSGMFKFLFDCLWTDSRVRPSHFTNQVNGSTQVETMSQINHVVWGKLICPKNIWCNCRIPLGLVTCWN